MPWQDVRCLGKLWANPTECVLPACFLCPVSKSGMLQERRFHVRHEGQRKLSGHGGPEQRGCQLAAGEDFMSWPRWCMRLGQWPPAAWVGLTWIQFLCYLADIWFGGNWCCDWMWHLVFSLINSQTPTGLMHHLVRRCTVCAWLYTCGVPLLLPQCQRTGDSDTELPLELQWISCQACLSSAAEQTPWDAFLWKGAANMNFSC